MGQRIADRAAGNSIRCMGETFTKMGDGRWVDTFGISISESHLQHMVDSSGEQSFPYGYWD